MRGAARPAPAVDSAAVQEPAANEVSNLPVLAEARPIERPADAMPPISTAAAGGFLAGVATFVLVRMLRRARGARVPLRRGRRQKGLEVTATRSFLVDVHVLKR